MSAKRIDIGQRPATERGADTWVRSGDPALAAPTKATLFAARLTIDVTPELRGRIKVVAFRRGMTVADMLRELLEREFPNTEPRA
jgi:hypothetical protein